MVSATGLLTAAGGAMDAWVYLGHGHVFANAQSGNVVLLGVALAGGDLRGAGAHVPSLVAYIVGLLASRMGGDALKRRGRNSRTIRLAVVCLLLLALGPAADRLGDGVVTAAVGFVAAVQTTSLSHVGQWSFNTGMTTGNLRSAAAAVARGFAGDGAAWPQARLMGVLSVAFLAGAVLGGWLSPRLHGESLWVLAAMVAAATLVAPGRLDPLPAWEALG